jgi:hypothetical protein
MVGEKDVAEFQAVLLERPGNRPGVARVDNRTMIPTC